MKKPYLAFLLVLTAGAVQAAPPVKASPVPPPQPYFVANCFNCHGTDGKATGAIQPLAGRDRAYLEQALKAFQSGERPSTIMQKHAKGYTDEEIAILADYFSKQK